uniref:Putative secreted protein n=1 Tax=Anopheles darlingi TaxID=43151 RepID=A0A2M4DRK6_ANODA
MVRMQPNRVAFLRRLVRSFCLRRIAWLSLDGSCRCQSIVWALCPRRIAAVIQLSEDTFSPGSALIAFSVVAKGSVRCVPSQGDIFFLHYEFQIFEGILALNRFPP